MFSCDPQHGFESKHRNPLNTGLGLVSLGLVAAVFITVLSVVEVLLASEPDEELTVLRSQIEELVLDHTTIGADSLVVELASFRMPPRAAGCRAELSNGAAGTDKRGVIRVKFYGASGSLKSLANLSVGWQLRCFKQMPVAAKFLGRQVVLAENDVRMRLCDVTRIDPSQLISMDYWAGKRSRRRIAEGTILLKRMLETRPDVLRNQKIILKLDSPGVRIELPVRCQQDACIGDNILVRVEHSGQRIRARLLSTEIAMIEEQQ